MHKSRLPSRTVIYQDGRIVPGSAYIHHNVAVAVACRGDVVVRIPRRLAVRVVRGQHRLVSAWNECLRPPNSSKADPLLDPRIREQ